MTFATSFVLSLSAFLLIHETFGISFFAQTFKSNQIKITAFFINDKSYHLLTVYVLTTLLKI